MALTENAFLEFKHDYAVYGCRSVMDQYNNEQRIPESEPKCTIHVMWHPVSDEASIAAFGDRVLSMLQAVYYGSESIENFDRISINGDQYEVVSIKVFNTYRLILVRKL